MASVPTMLLPQYLARSKVRVSEQDLKDALYVWKTGSTCIICTLWVHELKMFTRGLAVERLWAADCHWIFHLELQSFPKPIYAQFLVANCQSVMLPRAQAHLMPECAILINSGINRKSLLLHKMMLQGPTVSTNVATRTAQRRRHIVAQP